MKIEKVIIKNFRSIKDEEIILEKNCKILIGLNESGKSNILKALSTLGSYSFNVDDHRQELPDETPIKEAYVDFILILNDTEMKTIYETCLQKIICKDPTKSLIIEDGKSLNLKEYCLIRKKGTYYVDIKKHKANGQFYAINESQYSVNKDWKMPSDKCPDDFTVKFNNKEINLKSTALIYYLDFPEIPNEYLSEISPKTVNTMIGLEVAKYIGIKKPNCLYWKYDEKYILPASIDIDEFVANPDICIPLKNMFILSCRQNISDEILEAKKGRKNQLDNLLSSVAKQTTKHFKSVWKEYKNIDFELTKDGNNIIPSVKELNKFDFLSRSDGFKRFVSFLLMVSTIVKTGDLKDTLLLVDEPDISLHPSGIRFLRDELIEISKKNCVVISTHSIFMIDNDNIDRHLIVTKKKEITSIQEANMSDIFNEEVLYNALGYTIYDVLKRKNILFEGWRDQKLFQIATLEFPTTYQPLSQKFANVGNCFSKGVKEIKFITPLLDLAKKECFVLSDSDDAAKEKQKEFKKNKCYGIWKRYDEIFSSRKIITSEDFICQSRINELLTDLSLQYSFLNDGNIASINFSNGVIPELKKITGIANVAPTLADEFFNTLKDRIYENLDISHIESDYYDFLSNLVVMLKLEG
jgi:predicted ATP-dependent endonuclease of OLD family